MENSIAVKNQWTQEQIDTIKKTVAAGASEAELQMFLHLATKYQLDPFAKEIFLIQLPSKNGSRNSIMTSRDGYLSIAERNPHYQGMDSDAVYENDNFVKDNNGIHHTYSPKNRGRLIGGFAAVYRDDRKTASYFFAPIGDYFKENQVWRQYPHAMIVKVAESMALKRAFSISGLVTQEEIQNDKIDAPMSKNEEILKNGNIDRRVISDLWQKFIDFYDGDQEMAKNVMRDIVHGLPSANWTQNEIKSLEDFLISKGNDHIAESDGNEVIEAETVKEA